MDLHPVTLFPFEQPEEGTKMDFGKGHPGQVLLLQHLSVLRTVNPGGSDHFEREGISNTDVDKRKLPEGCRRGIIKRSVPLGHIGRGGNPRKTGFNKGHRPVPAAHWNHGERGPNLIFGIEIAGKFSDRHAVAKRDVEITVERSQLFFDKKSVDQIAPQRVRPVEHHNRNLALLCRLHAIKKSGGIGIGTAADILDIKDKKIDAIEHFTGRPARLSVQTINLKRLFFFVFHMVVSIKKSVDAMLGRKDSRHLASKLRTSKYVENRFKAAGDRRMIGDEADFFSLKKGAKFFFRNPLQPYFYTRMEHHTKIKEETCSSHFDMLYQTHEINS